MVSNKAWFTFTLSSGLVTDPIITPTTEQLFNDEKAGEGDDEQGWVGQVERREPMQHTVHYHTSTHTNINTKCKWCSQKKNKLFNN